MASLKRLSSVAHSLAHHAASGVSFIHPHVKRACRDAGQPSMVIELTSANPCPERFRSIAPLQRSLSALREKAQDILHREGFSLDDLEQLALRVDCGPSAQDDYSTDCYVTLKHRSGKTVQVGVSPLGHVLPAPGSSSLCPVCGFALGEAPWDGDRPSDEICPSCGIHFGYDDFAAGQRDAVYARWRARWIEGGMRWWSQNPAPERWDPRAQLKRANLA